MMITESQAAVVLAAQESEHKPVASWTASALPQCGQSAEPPAADDSESDKSGGAQHA